MSSVRPLVSHSRQSPSGLETVLRTVALTKTYRMGEVDVPALRGVDLALYQGEFLVLLGVSGSGKSTLLNILGGLDVPTSGRVYYRGADLTTAGEADLTRYRRYHVGFVFQFYNLIPSLTARENVALVTEIVPDPHNSWSRELALRIVGRLPCSAVILQRLTLAVRCEETVKDFGIALPEI